MDRLSRTDSRYLQLFTEEHNVLKSEMNFINEYKSKENEERELFYYLSTSLRDSQEKERARVERIKYLQLSLSIICTVLGIISAYLLNYFRNSNIREILHYNKEQFEVTHNLLNDLISKNNDFNGKTNQELDAYIKEAKSLALKNEEILNKNLNQKPNVVEKPIGKQNPNQNLIQPITLHPYILSVAVVIGYIFYISNK
jgi:hypothetical protein